jgi:hypothetical protein
MSCRNGEVTSTNLASANPHYVRVSLPEHGFGNDFDAMVQFYRERGEELRAEYSRARTDRPFWIYFCFRDPRNAEDFAERFSGERFAPTAFAAAVLSGIVPAALAGAGLSNWPWGLVPRSGCKKCGRKMHLVARLTRIPPELTGVLWSTWRRFDPSSSPSASFAAAVDTLRTDVGD